MKAIALISGGLDSILAARIIKEQGIDVIPLNFRIPFGQCKKPGCQDTDIKSLVRLSLGKELKIVDISVAFLELVLRPKYGFGSNMNPCIDCKILMFTRARELLPELGASFVVTGEVLGQRPMSQNRQALGLIKYRSGLGNLLLRPLSAKFFEPSLPEREGWVKREKLLDFSGRVRRPQMELAENLGIARYANPAGGCLLTDPCFSRRLKELLEHRELNLENLQLLKVGRHFRIGKETRLVVGRDERENNSLIKLARPVDYLFHPQDDLAGPVSLARGLFCSEPPDLCLQITCAYSDTGQAKTIDVFYRQFSRKEEKARKVSCAPKSDFAHLLI